MRVCHNWLWSFMVHPPSVYRLARAKTKFFIIFCYMVPHWLKIAIQTLHETENMANTGPLYRLFPDFVTQKIRIL